MAAEIHPYDVTVERAGAAEAYDCKWGARGINADVLHQLDDARTHAADEDERLAVALVVFDAARSCAVRLDRQTAPTEGTALVALETLDELAGRAAMTSGRTDADGFSAPFRVRFDEAGARRPAPDVRPAPLRAGPRLDPLGRRSASTGRWYGEHGLTWLVRAAERRGPRRRSRSARR